MWCVDCHAQDHLWEQIDTANKWYAPFYLILFGTELTLKSSVFCVLISKMRAAVLLALFLVISLVSAKSIFRERKAGEWCSVINLWISNEVFQNQNLCEQPCIIVTGSTKSILIFIVKGGTQLIIRVVNVRILGIVRCYSNTQI